MLPCMVDLATTGFEAIWDEVDQHPTLKGNTYTCFHKAFRMTIVSEKSVASYRTMEYSGKWSFSDLNDLLFARKGLKFVTLPLRANC